MSDRTSIPAKVSELLSLIYRCVQEDETWAQALELLRQCMNANVGCLRIATKEATPRQILFAQGPLVDEGALEEWAKLPGCELAPSMLRCGDVTVIDWRNDVTSTQVQEVLARYDVAYTITMSVLDDEGSQITLNCSRGATQPKFDELDVESFVDFASHFQRTIRMRRDFTKAQVVSQFQTQALDSLGIAAILVNQSNSVTPLNETAKFALEREIGLKQTSRGLVAAVSQEDAILRKVLKGALTTDAPGTSHAMSIFRDDSFNRVHLIVRSQTCPSAVSADEEACALIFMRVNDVVDQIDIKLLQEQFSFTMTEASVAVGLARGLLLKEVEERLNIRHNTARAHLRSMFSKADVERQSQLVSLLTSSLVPLGRDPASLLQ